MNEELKNMLKSIESNKLVKVNDNITLTNNQIEILDRYKIDYKTSNSIRDLMLKIEDYTDYDNNDELENLLDTLSERNYYENTNK